MNSIAKRAGLGLAALGPIALALAASSAQAAAYIKFDGVDGEAKVEVSWKVEKGEKIAPDTEESAGFTGGVRVATGDVDGDGRADIAAPEPVPQPIALLLPAVQKVREAASGRPTGMACTVGDTLTNLIIRNEDTAQIVRVPEAVVTACSAESVSFTFSKVEWVDPYRMPPSRPDPRRKRYGPGGGGSGP